MNEMSNWRHWTAMIDWTYTTGHASEDDYSYQRCLDAGLLSLQELGEVSVDSGEVTYEDQGSYYRVDTAAVARLGAAELCARADYPDARHVETYSIWCAETVAEELD